MSVAANQQRTFFRLIEVLRPHWRRDLGLPARIQALLAAHREFGSRDRRLYRELIYTTLRYLPWIEPLLDTDRAEATRRLAWLAVDAGATRHFRAAFATGEPPTGDKAELLPGWFRPHCPELFLPEELETQLRRAPLWLRLQTASEAAANGVFKEFESLGWEWRRSPVLPAAIELLTEADVTRSTSWQDGLFEVQDLGSQLILASVGIQAGRDWLDACAGAGGKTLQLAQLLGPQGHVDAHDVRRAALVELAERAKRADAIAQADHGREPSREMAAIAIHAEVPSRLYDGVLVDAPCSGSGTWRRAPHLKWVTREDQLVQASHKQRALLREFSARVAPGGRLVYATCSLSRRENEEVVASFLAEQPAFGVAARKAEFQSGIAGMRGRAELGRDVPGKFGGIVRAEGITFMPSVHNTDGFFVASLRRQSPELPMAELDRTENDGTKN